eukprot:gb/GECG01009853.1/.p1 GENE.gb/GECG01009853.1/~~gb/GECG01009853.1/.p1  ORF type:complete len:580 (+),score=73.67 gb/GECG01009853.1/:1-1740(+)
MLVGVRCEVADSWRMLVQTCWFCISYNTLCSFCVAGISHLHIVPNDMSAADIREVLLERFGDRLDSATLDDEILEYILSLISHENGGFSVTDDAVEASQPLIEQFLLTEDLTRQEVEEVLLEFVRRLQECSSVKEATDTAAHHVDEGDVGESSDAGVVKSKQKRKKDIPLSSFFDEYSAATSDSATQSNERGDYTSDFQCKLAPMKPVCRHLLDGGCFRADCEFSHDVSYMPCRFWLQGTCEKGDACPFSHEFDSRKQKPESLIACKFYFDSGWCRNGDSCPFSHGETRVPAEDKPTFTETPDKHELVPQSQPRADSSQPWSFSDRMKLQQLQEMFPDISHSDIKRCFLDNGRIIDTAQEAIVNDYGVHPHSVNNYVAAPNSSRDGIGGKSGTAACQSSKVQQYIRKIPWVETGGNLSASYKSFRQEAEELARARYSYFNRATNAFRNNRKAEAKRLAAEGRRLEKQIREANAKAAAEIYAQRNAKLAEQTDISAIDVHGLLPEEAIEAIEEYLFPAQGHSSEQKWVCIVTGTGHHSRTGKAALRDEVASYLEELQVPYFETSRDGRGGMFMVQMQQAS